MEENDKRCMNCEHGTQMPVEINVVTGETRYNFYCFVDGELFGPGTAPADPAGTCERWEEKQPRKALCIRVQDVSSFVDTLHNPDGTILREEGKFDCYGAEWKLGNALGLLCCWCGGLLEGVALVDDVCERCMHVECWDNYDSYHHAVGADDIDRDASKD